MKKELFILALVAAAPVGTGAQEPLWERLHEIEAPVLDLVLEGAGWFGRLHAAFERGFEQLLRTGGLAALPAARQRLTERGHGFAQRAAGGGRLGGQGRTGRGQDSFQAGGW